MIGDRPLKRVVQIFDAMPQQVLKANQNRRVEVERLRFAESIDDRDGDAVFLQRRDGEVAVRADSEVPRAPPLDHVQSSRIVNAPALRFDELLGVRFHLP